MGDTTSTSFAGNGRSRKGMSSATAVVVLVITIVVLGAISFVVFNTPSKTCAPSTSPVCTKVKNDHDVSILAPFTTAQQGQLIPFTALLTNGETATQFKFNFGDGSPIATSATPTVDHAYSFPGTYLVYAQAIVGGVTHDNVNSLETIVISASHARDTLGTQPGVSGAITANTTSTTNPTGVLLTGQSITVSAHYTSNASDPAYGLITPTLVSSGGTLGTPTVGSVAGFASVTATATFATAGVYTVTFVGGTQLTSTSPINYQNYTWTAYVSSPSGSPIVTPPTTDPHPGKLIVYELAPGGAGGEDPQVDYETVGFEVIMNVYQSLITYNGSKALDTPNGFIPVIASCVPGSATCGSQFPSEPGGAGEVNLVDGYNYTFVIGSSSQFYDPSTGAHWGVWPSDVLFTYAEDLAMASDGEATPSWILGQALLPYGNAEWDSGLHAPYNSTASNIFQHILVNDSAFCPTAAQAAPYHGCVTFVVNGTGTTPGAKSWPYFLQLLSGVGSGIVPAGWYSAQGSILPGWTDATGTGMYSGDHPVPLPGDSTSSSGASFDSAVAAIAAAQTTKSGWDAVTTNLPSNDWGNVQYNMVGSGPYYTAGYTIGTSYTLKANPYYEENPACTSSYAGTENFCYPAAGTYAGEVDVTWEVDATPGEAALASGVADFATIPTTQTALTLQLIEQGKADAISFPSISIFFFAYDMDFSAAAAAVYPTGEINVPGDWFSYIGMRNFFSTAYPYATSESTINTVGGIQYDFNYGGVIPQGMGNYYPTNISFPSTDPTNNVNDPSSPAYWWAQMTTVGSPYYDPEAAACTAANPCQVPFFGQTGAPNYDQALALEVQSVSEYSHGAVEVHTLDINFVQLVINSLFSSPGTNPMPIFTLGWAPDYPDPTDYIGAMYYPNATYTYSDDYNQFTENTSQNSTSCEFDSIGTYSFAALQYWAAPTTQIANDCQGPAFNAMTFAEYYAAGDTNLVERALIYNMGEQIAQKLALYIYFAQQNEVYTYAPWINGLSINEQVTIGGGTDQPWFWIDGNGVAG
jgi:peptide/nickel transport system substrate-binding protein